MSSGVGNAHLMLRGRQLRRFSICNVPGCREWCAVTPLQQKRAFAFLLVSNRAGGYYVSWNVQTGF